MNEICPECAALFGAALLAAGRWRTIAAACLMLAVLIAVTALLFGIESWSAFLASTGISRKILLENGAVGFEKLQSAFAVVRLWGGGVTLAYTVQALVSCAVVAGIIWCWRVTVLMHARDRAAAQQSGRLRADVIRV